MSPRRRRIGIVRHHPPLVFIVAAQVPGVRVRFRTVVIAVTRALQHVACSTVAVSCALACEVSPLAAQGMSEPVRYRVTSTSVVTLSRARQEALVDTITTTSLVSIQVMAGMDTVATMLVDSLQQTSTGMVRRLPDASAGGVSVAARLVAGRPPVTGDSATACATERPLAGLLPELLPLLPAVLRADQQWSDTVTVITCRAGLPVMLQTIATYRTLTGMDAGSLLLERRAVLRANGVAVLRAQTVTLDGSGTGESLAVVSLATRRMVSWRGSQSLELEISNGQQVRRLVQQVADVATLVVP
jgi:hypothetical protein